jgi:hypothetical protein
MLEATLFSPTMYINTIVWFLENKVWSESYLRIWEMRGQSLWHKLKKCVQEKEKYRL